MPNRKTPQKTTEQLAQRLYDRIRARYPDYEGKLATLIFCEAYVLVNYLTKISERDVTAAAKQIRINTK